MSIDVVVPCYRYGHFLRQCVHSVTRQRVDGLRVLIVDDASPDDTAAIAKELARDDPRVSVLGHPVNRGHIATYNEGIAWLRADLMLLLSADDYLLPDALPRAIDLMQRHGGVGLCVGQAIELSGRGERRMTIGIDSSGTGTGTGAGTGDSLLDATAFTALVVAGGSQNIVPTPTAVVRTDLLHRLGGYRADLPHTADLELWLRLAAHAQVGIVAADQAVYRRHAANMSLGYADVHCLLDLQQRKAAFDAFRASCGAVLPQAETLYRQLLAPLASEAVRRAAEAFSRSRLTAADELGEFAIATDPAIARTLAWRQLRLQRALNVRVPSAWLPAAARARRATARLVGSLVKPAP